MKFGLQLHQERGGDAVLDEARLADAQGFDSVWLFDHLMAYRAGAEHHAHEPLETFRLMTAVGAVTRRVRLAFATLNLSFRHPPVLAKMLATLDQITHGRVICSIGAGWFEEECRAYGIPVVADHDERVGREREIALLFKELSTHHAPELTTFEGQYVAVHGLPFNPAPYQRPHPPIWVGGDSDFNSSAGEGAGRWLGHAAQRHSGGMISVAEAWIAGPGASQNARWDPAQLGPVVDDLVAKARGRADISGQPRPSAEVR